MCWVKRISWSLRGAALFVYDDTDIIESIRVTQCHTAVSKTAAFGGPGRAPGPPLLSMKDLRAAVRPPLHFHASPGTQGP